MEAMQDKLIREKLNSLDSLPEGYTPSLDSKWELLRAGKPEKKKTPLYFWYTAAASLLLLFGLSFSFWQTEKQTTEKTIAQQEIPIEKANPKVPENFKPEPETKVSLSVIAGTNSEQKNGIVKAAKTVVSKQKTVNLPKDSVLRTTVETQISEEAPVLIAAETKKTTPKKKSRYVELDFDAPETPQRLPQPVQTAQLQFKIRLMPKAESDQTSAQEQNPLRLQHTF